MSLEKYKEKRDFSKTSEPTGGSSKAKSFIVHKHAASHLHYDLRLSNGKVLISFAIPKGMPTKKNIKHFAKHVEDHPLDYQNFEGNIPEGEYGGGSVMIYDKGVYGSDQIDKHIKKGHLKFSLDGNKFNGTFNLIRLKNEDWIITSDQDISSLKDPLEEKSAKSERIMAEIFLDKKIDYERAKKMPIGEIEKIKPMLCKIKDEPFDSEEWLFEPKLDGYRALSKIDLGLVEVLSRNGQSLNEKYHIIQKELKKFKFKAVLDGEIVLLDENGVPSFSMLQSANNDAERLFYYVFDILSFEDHDLTGLPLNERKKLLEQLIPQGFKVRYTPHVVKRGKAFFDKLSKIGFEGTIAKKISSKYQVDTRSNNWLKIKKIPEIDAVIVGYTAPKKSREYFGSLALAKETNSGNLEFIGLVGTGFNDKALKNVFSKLEKLKEGESLSNDNSIKWVTPRYYCRVRYLERTAAGALRHPSFLGLLEDRFYEPSNLSLSKPKETTLTINDKTIAISNPEKIFFPEKKIRKIDLVNYYLKIADYLLPFLIDRPQNMHRYPDGIYGEHFYHKDSDFQKSPLSFYKIKNTEEKSEIRYSVIKDTAGLIYLVNLGCIEINPWLSKISNIDKPDILVFDLDPGDNIGFEKVIETAFLVKNFFDELDVKTYVKTTGATGLHIFIPIKPDSSYESVKLFAEVCSTLISRKADFISITRDPNKRKNKVYLDFLQNRFGQTTASIYCVRPNKDALISAPINWNKLKFIKPKDYSIDDFDKIEINLWDDFFENQKSIKDMTKSLSKLINS